MDLWWCRFLKGGRTEAPAEKPLTSRSQVLIRSDGTSTFAASHTTVRHYTYPIPPLHWKLFQQLLPWGEGGSQTKDHGTVSQLFLNSFLASKTGASNMWKNNIFPSRNVWEPDNLFSLLRCRQLFRQPTCAVIGSCCLYWLPKRPHKTQLLMLVPGVLWTFFLWRLTNINTKKAARRMSTSIKGRKRL